MKEEYKIKDFIEQRKKYYLKEIQRNDPACVNIEELKNMVNNFSYDEWVDFMVKEFSDYYIINIDNGTFTLK